MYRIDQLELMTLNDLKFLAIKIGINNLDINLDKQNLIYQILNYQSLLSDKDIISLQEVNSKILAVDDNKKNDSYKKYSSKKVNNKLDKTNNSNNNLESKESKISKNNNFLLKNNNHKLNINEENKIEENIEFKSQEKVLKEDNFFSKKFLNNNLEDEKSIVLFSGLLEVVEDGYGFIRSSRYNYSPSSDDVYLSQFQIKSSMLKTGDTISGYIRSPKNSDEKYCSMVKIETINGVTKENILNRVSFDRLCPTFPDDRFNLELDFNQYSTRIIDLFSPIGKGQRALIVAPPKTGKTVLLEQIAKSISYNHPKVHLIALLIDERPEEVTHMSRVIQGEVFGSTFDETPKKHTRLANIILEKSKRLVESGKDVVILLDSLTRLTRSFNAVTVPSGRILSGGIDVNAFEMPKKFFGAARNIEKGGSLTIIATILVDTNSKMDEVIFEEFKGRGNMEVYLDRELSERRIFPGINIISSGTRNEEKLMSLEDLAKIREMRKFMRDMKPKEIIDFILDRMKKTNNNKEFLDSISMM
jgi:transcription termination factor Rho